MFTKKPDMVGPVILAVCIVLVAVIFWVFFNTIILGP